MKSQNPEFLPTTHIGAAEVEQVLRRMIASANHQMAAGAEKLSMLRSQPDRVGERQEIILALREGDADYTLVRTTTKLPMTHKLSQREQEIARLIAAGCSDKMIAHHLTLSACTVSTYVRRIFGKLAVNSRAEMVARLVEINLL